MLFENSHRRLASSVVLAAAAWTLSACSDSATDPTPAADSGTGEGGGGGGGGDAGTGSDSGGGGDAGTDPVNACRMFVDRTGAGASRTITWDFTISTAEDRCMQVKVGQAVTFGNGSGGPADFNSHPVIAQGGDKPNPVTNVDTGTGEVTFSAPGTFGYACGNHPAMLGAFLVVP